MLALIVLDHLADHLPAHAAVFRGRQVAVVALCHVDAKLAGHLELHVFQLRLALLAHCSHLPFSVCTYFAPGFVFYAGKCLLSKT